MFWLPIPPSLPNFHPASGAIVEPGQTPAGGAQPPGLPTSAYPYPDAMLAAFAGHVVASFLLCRPSYSQSSCSLSIGVQFAGSASRLTATRRIGFLNRSLISISFRDRAIIHHPLQSSISAATQATSKTARVMKLFR